MSNDVISLILYIIMGVLFLLLIVLCIPWFFDIIVDLKDEWELFKFRMRGE